MKSPGAFGRNEHVLSLEAAGRAVRLTFPARAEYVALSRLALTGLARVRPISEETLADLKLAITEACSNAVRHAYPAGEGFVTIRYELEPDRIAIEVGDEGTGFDTEGRGELPALGDLNEGGLGIAIIRSVADELELGAGPAGTGSRLRFVKSLD